MAKPSSILPILAQALLGLCACSPSTDPNPATPRPDVLFIVVDTLRADRLEPYGYPRPTSPNLAALAERGALFEDVTAQGSWTKTSMVSLLQSRILTSYRDLPLEDAPILGEIFKEAGYRTLAVVANGLLSHRDRFDRGFDRFENTGKGSEDASGTAENLTHIALSLFDEALTDETAGTRSPILAWLHLMEPHDPYEEHPEYAQELPVDDGLLASRPQRFESLTQRKLREGAWHRVAVQIANYDREVRAADHWIGVLLDGVRSRTGAQPLVVVAADHGEGLWEHALPPESREPHRLTPSGVLQSGHGKVLTMNLVHTPLILSGPGIPEGVRIDTPVMNVDLLPTLLDLCSIPAPPGLDGISLAGSLQGRPLPRRPVYSHVLRERAVRDTESNWRLVLPMAGCEEVRFPHLHDALNDPLEQENAYESRTDVVQRLQTLLEEVEAEHPTPTTLGRKRSQEEQRQMSALGYTGDDG